ncbi:MAG TPA: 2OG-Fe(II) oxygenase [Vicinamibacterales bacterium]|nr:2OG-Fe(II) oxygenase [Vicinamibacterales bacterium]
MLLRPIDAAVLRHEYATADPFPFVRIEPFLDDAFAEAVAAAYPTFERAAARGRVFRTVNERMKVQITDAALFPEPVRMLSESLASPAFLAVLSSITGISDLLPDEQLEGGGMHITGPGGRLDVHVDFNYLEERQLHRRVNLLLFLNPAWQERWGGQLQFWDREVRQCERTFSPLLNRCVVFETSDRSFHGVAPLATDAPVCRRSFAAYYYTREAPANWTASIPATVFRARPEEWVRASILMPTERIQRRLEASMRKIKGRARRFLRRSS